LGIAVRLKGTGADTGGVAEVLELEFPPGAPFPAHSHRTYDEGIYVAAGELTVTLAGQALPLRAGGFVFAPRGTVHGFENRGATAATAVIWQTPSYGVERMLEAVSQLPPGPPDPARLGPILAQFDIHPAGPPPDAAGT
jgi:quercetin dioxygenase-like cupin family protein